MLNFLITIYFWSANIPVDKTDGIKRQTREKIDQILKKKFCL